MYLTAEDSRGKGVPIDILQNQSKENILVRDDYAVYKNLKLTHQSCWAHLMRKSHERNIEPDVSQEMKDVHTLLSNIFCRFKRYRFIPF